MEINYLKEFRKHFSNKIIFSLSTLFLFFCLLNLNAQIEKEPILLNQSAEFNSKRLTTVIISETALASIVTVGLQYLWYKKYPKSSFHFFDDNDEWLQMDKMGHATTAYNISAVQ